MNLDPNIYRCPDHQGVDLTDQVREILEEDGIHVAFARKSKPRRFEVRVTCPGVQGNAAHELFCSGSWSK